MELADAGFAVALSHRSPVEFGAGPLAMWFFLRILSGLESIKLHRLGDRARDWDVKMPGGRAKRLIQEGTVRTFPAIRRFERRAVVFEDGTTLEPSMVVFATGFRPALEHLRAMLPELDTGQSLPALHGMESANAPGLFFIGIEYQRNFQSRYIRGIRLDVAVLAEQLQARLQSLPSVPPPSPATERGINVIAR